LIYINMNDQTLPPPYPFRLKLILRYLTSVGVLNLVWEILQLPLYTLSSKSPPAAIAFAVVHCTLGDVLIAAISFIAALVLLGGKNWPQERYWRVALLAVAVGASYTVFSEWNNTVVTRDWAYSLLMPTLWGIGLSPVLQWLLIPTLVFWWLSKRRAGDRA
jgi:hypothetical protein